MRVSDGNMFNTSDKVTYFLLLYSIESSLSITDRGANRYTTFGKMGLFFNTVLLRSKKFHKNIDHFNKQRL